MLATAALSLTACSRRQSAGSADAPDGAPTTPRTPHTILEENQRDGSTDWPIERPALDGEIQAYAGQTSAQRGDNVDLHVSVRSGGVFDADVYRMGWYGGAGARKAKSFRNIPGEDQGRWDPRNGLQGCKACKVDAATLLVEANWRPALSIRIADDWWSGYYVVKLHDQSSDTSTYAVFTVRDDDSREPILVQASTNTWQSYNDWGDASTYGSFGADRQYIPKRRRAYRVSYDRPYDPQINHSTNYGAGEFFSWEYNFVRWAESMGYDMSYTTDVDVSRRPDALKKHRMFISLGHDEYWTKQQRDAVEAARDAGVNVAFFGANEAYWQARLEASSAGIEARTLVVYKDAALDPLAHARPQETTVLFHDPPVSRPESLLSGSGYGSNTTPDYQSWRPANLSSWVFAGTGMLPGDAFPGIVGYEYDNMAPADERPPGLLVVGSSPVRGFIGDDTSVSTLYQAPGGALVFCAGTVAWSWGLDDYGHQPRGSFSHDKLRRMTQNIIDRLGGGLAARP